MSEGGRDGEENPEFSKVEFAAKASVRSSAVEIEEMVILLFGFG